MSSATAPGKIILFGEHAVVYGQPAIAVPVTHIQAKAIVEPWQGGAAGSGQILAPNVGLDALFETLSPNHPIAAALTEVQTTLGIQQLPPFRLRIRSTIPVAGGMGSGAAVSVAVIRAFSAFLGQPLPD